MIKLGSEPAFPDYEYSKCLGLTKREYFAGLVMQGLATKFSTHSYQRDAIDINVQISVQLADALLRKLKETE